MKAKDQKNTCNVYNHQSISMENIEIIYHLIKKNSTKMDKEYEGKM